MIVRTTPDEKYPSHHISLSDGQNVIGLVVVNAKGEATFNAITKTSVPRTAMKTTTGSQTYSDYEPPWTPIAQEDWSGGMSLMDFDKDATRYLASIMANAMYQNKVFLGAQPNYGRGIRKQDGNLPGSMSWSALVPGSRQYLARKFEASDSYDGTYISIHVKRVGTPVEDLTISLLTNAGDEPDTVLQTATISTSDITDIVSEFYRVEITPEALTVGTNYWVEVYSSDGDTENHWKVGVKAESVATKESPDGSTWSESSVDLYFRITDADTEKYPFFFKYKCMDYLFLSTDTAAPQLFLNGDRGAADANTGFLNQLKDSSKSWTENEWAGCVVKIIKGKGSEERQNWREIISNGTQNLVVSPSWKIEHDTTTEYIILGSDTMTEVTGHGCTKAVTDVCVVNDIAYICQGDATNIRRMREYNNAGVWTSEYADDGSNKAVFMKTVRDATSGLVIWRAQNNNVDSNIAVSKASVVDWPNNLSFATAIPFKEQWGRITGIEEFGDPKKLWVLREGSFFAASGTSSEETNLTEIHTMMDAANGVAHITSNAYMYFNLGAGIERYADKVMDDVGPTREEGLPENRRGIVSFMLSYPGRFFAAIDGGEDHYSSVLGFNGTGWHDYYRSPMPGMRILAMAFQSVTYNFPGRMWIHCGSDVLWLPFSPPYMDPTKDSNMTFAHESVLESGYMYVGMVDVYKFFRSIKIFAEGLKKDKVWVEVDYKVDDDETWTPINGMFEESPVSELNLNERGVDGKRFAYRLRLQTSDNTRTPIVKTVVVECISRVPVKYSYGFNYRVMDLDVDLRGAREERSAEEKQNMINYWAENLIPLTMHSINRQFDDKTVFIDPATLTPLHETDEGYVAKMTIIEI